MITLCFGAVLFVTPTRGRLWASIVWGLLSLAFGVLQIAGGSSHWTIFAGTAGAAIAAVLAFAGLPAPQRSAPHLRHLRPGRRSRSERLCDRCGQPFAEKVAVP